MASTSSTRNHPRARRARAALFVPAGVARLLVLGLAIGGCDGTSPTPDGALPDGALLDGGSGADAAMVDGGLRDGGPTDAGPGCACTIGGTCYAEGAPNPDNPCERCEAAVSETTFSPNDGASCDDGVHCNGADSCLAGACSEHGGNPCDDGVACNGEERCDEAERACRAGDAVCGLPTICDVAMDRCVSYNYAFVSPVAANADLGGLAGADALCATWAEEFTLRPGAEFVAVLSTETVDASSRLGSARGFIRPDGRPVADEAAELFAEGPLAPLRLTPDGTDVGNTQVWSASNWMGTFNDTADGTDCNGWDSASSSLLAWYGFADATVEWLSRGTRAACSEQRHIYCVQVNLSNELRTQDFAEPDGRLMFPSSGHFVTTDGLAGADALCSADAATDPSLAGRTFRAFLATDGASAASRFTSSSALPIVRPDGLRIADDFDALTTGDLHHPIELQLDGTRYSWLVFTGADTPLEAGAPATTCQGWTTNTEGTARTGMSQATSAAASERRFFGNNASDCPGRSGSIPVYCLED